MAKEEVNQNAGKLVLASTDSELVALAKGAIPNTSEQQLTIIQKQVGDLVNDIRDIEAEALIIDIDASRVEDFENLQKIKRMIGNATAIIVISSSFSPAAARILIQLKVADFLVKPVQTSDLVRSCNNAMKINTQETQVEPQFQSFMPASGGVGTTSMAIEAASILNSHGQKIGRTTCIVDLNFQHGACAEYLDLEPRFDISEIENAPERLDRQLLDVMLSKHDSGLSVICAPNQPTEMRSFKGALVVRLLDLVSAYFDNVVIDLPRTWFPWTETVLTGSDKVFVVADMTVPSIRHSHRLVKAIEERLGKQSEPRVVVNRMDFRNNATGLNATDVEGALGEYFGGGVPNNYRLVRDAVDRGVTLNEIEPGNNVTQALTKIVLAGEIEEDAQTTKKGGLFSVGRNLLKRKAG
ncbi:MAG: response regulator receiver protein [Pseudomonadota bacterium]